MGMPSTEWNPAFDQRSKVEKVVDDIARLDGNKLSILKKVLDFRLIEHQEQSYRSSITLMRKSLMDREIQLKVEKQPRVHLLLGKPLSCHLTLTQPIENLEYLNEVPVIFKQLAESEGEVPLSVYIVSKDFTSGPVEGSLIVSCTNWSGTLPISLQPEKGLLQRIEEDTKGKIDVMIDVYLTGTKDIRASLAAKFVIII